MPVHAQPTTQRVRSGNLRLFLQQCFYALASYGELESAAATTSRRLLRRWPRLDHGFPWKESTLTPRPIFFLCVLALESRDHRAARPCAMARTVWPLRGSRPCQCRVRTLGAYAGGESKSASLKFVWRKVRQNLNVFCLCVCLCVDD